MITNIIHFQNRNIYFGLFVFDVGGVGYRRKDAAELESQDKAVDRWKVELADGLAEKM
jgi:hypothetical protein